MPLPKYYAVLPANTTSPAITSHAPPKKWPSIRDIDRLLETVKWPLALIVLGFIFVNPLYKMITGNTAPRATTQIYRGSPRLVADLALADPNALHSSQQLAFETQVASTAQSLLIDTDPSQLHIRMIPGNADNGAVAAVLREVGFKLGTNQTPPIAVVTYPQNGPRFLVQALESTSSSTINFTAVDSSDLALKLALFETFIGASRDPLRP